MRIGVLSDTHGRLPEQIAELFRGCDHIIHAGDIGKLTILTELEAIAPVTAVLGNNDFSYVDSLPSQVSMELGGVRFLIAHRLEEIKYLLNAWPAGKILPAVCIFGHTHVPADSYQKPLGIRFINPGSLSYPRAGSRRSALILAAQGGVITETATITL